MYHTETLRYLTEEPKSILFLIVLCGMVALAIVAYVVLFVGFMFHRDTVMEHNQDATIHYMVKLDDNRRMQLINQANELPEGDYVKALVIQAETYFK